MNENIKAGADIHAGDGGYSVGTQEECDEFVKGRSKSVAQERIRELAEQCRYETYGVNSELLASWFDEEKFAELLLKDASRFVEDTFDFCGDEIIIAERIRERYGITE